MSLRKEQIIQIAREHELAEMDLDLDRIMATLVDEPIYYWYPQRLRIEGREAVRQMYVNMAPIIRVQAQNAKTQKVHFFALGEDQLAAESEFDCKLPDGTMTRVRIASFLKFEGERMMGETLYTDSQFAVAMDAIVFDTGFRKLPGVTVI